MQKRKQMLQFTTEIAVNNIRLFIPVANTGLKQDVSLQGGSRGMIKLGCVYLRVDPR